MHWRKRSKRRLAVLLAGLLICVLGVVALRAVRASQQQRLIAEARQAGLSAFAAGDMDTTLAHLSYFFEREKDDLEVNLAFAEARARIPIAGGRHLMEAIDLYSTHGLRLVERHPQLDPDGSKRHQMLERLLQLYCDAGMRYEIIESAEKLLAIDADHPQATGAKAEALCLDGKFEEALPLLQQMVAIEPDELRWRRLTLLALSETGATADQRIEQTRQWAAEYQGDGRFHVLAASMLLDQQEEELAREALKQAVERGAADALVLERACELMDDLNMRGDADAMIDATIAARANDAWPHEVNLRRLLYAGRIDEAVGALAEAQHSVAEFTPGLCRSMIVTCIAVNDRARAHDLLSVFREHSAAEHDSANVAWIDAVAAVMDADNHPLSNRLRLVNEALALNPDDAPLHMLAGDAWMEARETAQAITHYQRAFALEPSWQRAGMLYAGALLAAGRLDEAYDVSRIVLEQSAQHDARPLALFARVYLAMRAAGRLDHQSLRSIDVDGDVSEVVANLHEENPGNAEIAALHAESVMQFEGKAALDSLAQRTAQDDSTPDEMLLAIADVYLSHRQPINADLWERLSQSNNRNLAAAIALRRAESLALQGDAAAGLAILDQAIESGADLSVADHIARAQFIMQYNLPGAHDALAALVARFPDSIDVQQLALAQSAIEIDADVTSQALSNLERLVGGDSPQVRLAKAAMLLRDRNADEASLAKAIVQIENVLEESPDSLAALTLMAEAAPRSGSRNLKRAIESLERAANLYTADPALLARLIELLQQQGEYDRAGRYLRLLARVPDAAESLRRAELRLWHHQGDFDTALARASALVNEQSAVTDWLILAAIQHRAGKHNEAREIYERLLAQENPPPLVFAQAADFFAATGDLQRGIDLASKITLSDSCTSTDLIVGEFLLRHGEIAAAGERLQTALNRSPNCAAVRAAMARYYLATNDRTSARNEALQGIRLDPDNAALRSLFAIASIGMPASQRREALELLNQAKAGNEGLIAILSLLDSAPTSNGKVTPNASTLANAKRLLDEHGHFLPAWHLAIALHVEAGHVDEALRLARRAVGRFPADPEPAQWSTELLMEAGQWQAALADAYEWDRRSPVDSPMIQLALATILLELNRPEDAVHELEPLRAAFIEQRDQWPQRLALYLRAQVLSGHIDLAAEIIAPLLQNDPRWRTQWLELALIADEHYAPQMLTLLQPHVQSPDEQLHLAGAWVELGKTGCDECLQHAQTIALDLADSTKPEIRAGALLIRGGVAEAQQQWHDAESLYRQALAIDANHPIILNNLASVLARLPNGSDDEALQLIDRALALEPNNPDLLDTKAVILLGLGRPAEAEQFARHAAQLRPNDLRIAMSLAEAHLHQASLAEADVMLHDLQQRLKLQRRVDPELITRFEALREKWEQSQTETGM